MMGLRGSGSCGGGCGGGGEIGVVFVIDSTHIRDSVQSPQVLLYSYHKETLSSGRLQ